jgi:hypothetical protein
MLKASLAVEYHTTRTLVMKKTPGLPLSRLRFHTPLTCRGGRSSVSVSSGRRRAGAAVRRARAAPIAGANPFPGAVLP